MNKWRAFFPNEVNILTSKRKSMEDNTEGQCPCCGEVSVIDYFYETVGSRTIGSSWIWYHNCKKYIYFTGVQRSDRYEFDDPLANIDSSEMSRLQKDDNVWFDYLDSMWEQKILPQTFKRKGKK